MENEEFLTLVDNPFKDVNISILITVRNFDEFSFVYSSLKDTCSNPSSVEIDVKVDNYSRIEEYYRVLENSSFKYKVMIFPPYNRRFSNHHVYNFLAGMSSGRFMWVVTGDTEIVMGDWYSLITEVECPFKDGVYYINVANDDGKGTKVMGVAPIVTREWYNFFGNISVTGNMDRWTYELSKKINRYTSIPESKLLLHSPKGRRMYSKQQRKTIYRPLLEKYERKFNRRFNR